MAVEGLTFEDVEMPRLQRTPPDNRIRWEDELAPLLKTPNKPTLIFRFFGEKAEGQARGRASSIRDRFWEVNKRINLACNVRALPPVVEEVTDDEGNVLKDEAGNPETVEVDVAGLWVEYLGELTDEELAAKVESREERAEKIREKREANRLLAEAAMAEARQEAEGEEPEESEESEEVPEVEPPEAPADPPAPATAQDRIAAARAKRRSA